MNFLLRLIILIALTLTVLCNPTVALSEPILNELVGSWQCDSTARLGTQVKVTMMWNQTLGGKFFTQDYRINKRDTPDSMPLFAGKGFYKSDSACHYSGAWFDTHGDMHPLTATSDATSFHVTWGKPGGKYGKTVYQLLRTESSALVVDSIQMKDGNWREFARCVLKRL